MVVEKYTGKYAVKTTKPVERYTGKYAVGAAPVQQPAQTTQVVQPTLAVRNEKDAYERLGVNPANLKQGGVTAPATPAVSSSRAELEQRLTALKDARNYAAARVGLKDAEIDYALELQNANRRVADVQAQLDVLRQNEQNRLARAAKGAGKTYLADIINAVETTRQFTDNITPVNQGWVQQQAAEKVTQQPFYNAIDALSQSGQTDINRAKAGMSSAGKFLTDVGIAGAQLGIDAALGTPLKAAGIVGKLGAAMPTMATRVAGGSMAQARQDGATLNEQVAYGAASALLAIVVERFANSGKLLGKAFGKGIADDALERVTKNAIDKIAKTETGRNALYQVGGRILAGGTEALEEGAEALLQPLLQNLIYDANAEWDIEEILYQMAVGGALGGILGGGSSVRNAGASTQENVQDLVNQLMVSQPAAQPAEQPAAQQERQTDFVVDMLGNVRNRDIADQLMLPAGNNNQMEIITQGADNSNDYRYENIVFGESANDDSRLVGILPYIENGRVNKNAVNNRIAEIQNRMAEIEKIAEDYATNYQGQKADVQTYNNNEIGASSDVYTVRASMNDPWYRDFVQKNGRRPTKAERKELAKEILQSGQWQGYEYSTEYNNLADELNTLQSFDLSNDGDVLVSNENDGVRFDYTQGINRDAIMPVSPESRIAKQQVTEQMRELRRQRKLQKENAEQITKAFEQTAELQQLTENQVNSIKRIATKIGVPVEVVDVVYDRNGNVINGKFDGSKIVLSRSADMPVLEVLKHEILHFGKEINPKLYSKLEAAVLNSNELKTYLKESGYNTIENLRRRRYVDELGYTYEESLEEIVADFAGAYFDINKVESMVKPDNAIIRAIRDFIAYIKASFGGSKEIDYLERLYASMLSGKRKTPANADVKYSRMVFDDGTVVVILDGDYFTKENGKKMTPREAYNSLVGKEFELKDGTKITLVKSLVGEGKSKDMYNEFFRRRPFYFTSGIDVSNINNEINKNIEEILESSSVFLPNDPDVNNRHEEFGVVDFDQARVFVADDNGVYEFVLSIANLNNGEKIGYAKKTLFIDKEMENKIKKAVRFKKQSSSFSVDSLSNTSRGYQLSNQNIPQNKPVVKEKTAMEIAFEEANKNKEKASRGRGLSQINTEYMQAVENGDMETAAKLVKEAADETEHAVEAYHGTGRADRVGNVFLPKRATSGPMAFFTDNEEIAQGYARSKRDTSIAYDTEYDTYETQFRVKSSQGAKYPINTPIHRAWGYIPMSKRAKIRRKAEQLRYDWDGDDDRQFILDAENREANGGFQWQLKRYKDNVISALEEQWLNSGNLFNEEERFLEVLEKTGVTDAFKDIGLNVVYMDPNYREEKVYHVFLKITRPFDVTKQVTEAFVKRFENWVDKQDLSKYKTENMESDLWDKNGVSAEEFADRMRNDIERGTSHAWMSIPDIMTDYLKHLKYDGIKDVGGKQGGYGHTVWIPFYSNQIKSADTVTYDNSGNIIPLTERFDENKTDIRYSRGTGLPKGENPYRDVTFPAETDDGNVRRFYRTAAEAEATTDEMVADIEALALNDTYQVIGDKAAQTYANTILTQGIDKAFEKWNAVVNGDKYPSKNDIALGEQLYVGAVADGDTETAMRLLAEIAATGTRAGQVVQAMRMLKKMTPSGQLYYLQKIVDNLNKDIQKRFAGGKVKPIMISKQAADAIVSSRTQAELDSAIDAAKKEIIDQMPSSFVDMWNAWRYLAMLGNIRTHVRNIVGNGIFYPARRLANAIAAGTEKGLTLLPMFENIERTRSVLTPADKGLLDWARADFKANRDAILSTGKYNPSDDILDDRVVFKINSDSNIAKGLNATLLKGVDKLAKGNSNLLNKEDSLVMGGAYAKSLAGWLKANNLTPKTATPKQMEKARNFAIEEAQRYAFREASAFANALSRMSRSNKAGAVIVEGIMPFKKTPINIAKQGILEYSPIGVLSTVGKALKGVSDGKYSATEAVNDLSKGLTGTGILLLGYLMASWDLLKGAEDDDENQATFDNMNGLQNYSLILGDTSYTIDWAAPATLPLFVGAELYKVQNEGENVDTATVFDAMLNLSNPLIENSMLQGLQDALNAGQYSKDNLPATAISVATNYIGQGVPTLLGQFARTIDSTRRNSYDVDKENKTPDTLEKFIQKQMAKTPSLSDNLEPMIDRWGEIRTYEENPPLRAFDMFINPSYRADVNTDALTKELERLYQKTGDAGVVPEYADKYFQYDGKRYDLSGSDYTRFAQTQGKTARKLIDSLMRDSRYKKMSDSKKAEAVSMAYQYAKVKARKQYLPEYEGTSSLAWVEKCIDDNIDIEDYIVSKVAGVTKVEGDEGVALSASKKKKELIDKSNPNLSKAELEALYKVFGVSEKVW